LVAWSGNVDTVVCFSHATPSERSVVSMIGLTDSSIIQWRVMTLTRQQEWTDNTHSHSAAAALHDSRRFW